MAGRTDKLYRFPFPIKGNPVYGTVITGGAGDSHLIECANQELEQFFQSAIDSNTNVLSALNSFAAKFFKETMEPYRDAGESAYIPELEMVIAVNTSGKCRLFCWKKGRILEKFGHVSIGTGVTQIHPILRDVQFTGPCEGMLFHGVRMMYYAKRAVAGVGGKTEAIALKNDETAQYFGTKMTQEIEDLVENLEQFCNGFLYSEISNTFPKSSSDRFNEVAEAFGRYQDNYRQIIKKSDY